MMEGSSVVVDQEITTSPLTLALVGRKGNGKSATGNSILGTNAFRSARVSSGLTTCSEMKTITLENGQMLNVIDTPGLFDSSVSTNDIAKEITNCINMAGDGIHALLVVFSVRSRFSKEEEATVSSLRALFGGKVNDYMIVIFTGGDALYEEDETLEDFLSDCPEKLKETLNMCGNRCVLFDNKSKDQTKRANQLDELLFHVNLVSTKNGGRPYTNAIFSELKEQAKSFQAYLETKHDSEQGIWGLKEQMCEDQIKQMVEMVEQKLNETTFSLERQVAEEKAARVKAEEDVEATQKKLDEDKCYMNVQLMQKEKTLSQAARVKIEEDAETIQKKSDEGIGYKEAQPDRPRWLCKGADNEKYICVIL